MADGWTDVTRRGYVGIRQRGFGPNQGGTANASFALDQWFCWSGAFCFARAFALHIPRPEAETETFFQKNRRFRRCSP